LKLQVVLAYQTKIQPDFHTLDFCKQCFL